MNRRSAGRSLAGDRDSAKHESDESLAQKIRLGNCIYCHDPICVVSGAPTCPVCAAWRRWYQGARIASNLNTEGQ